MRFIILLLFINGAVSLSGVQAQPSLANTAWQGTVQLHRVMDVVLQFDNDTIRMYSVSDTVLPETKLLETMTYTTKGDTFTWRKVSGGSPCDAQTPGTWQYIIRHDELTLNRIDDGCEGRSGIQLGGPFKKVAFLAK